VAGIDLPGKSRQHNRDLNMIPFIDLLMVTIMFLLITAVWVTHSRIEATAQVPGGEGAVTGESPTLHVYASASEFTLSWKQGATTLTERRVHREPDSSSPRYDDLAKTIADEWRERGGHRDAADRTPDRCVLHTENSAAFREIVAMLDAIHEAKRDVVDPNGERRRMSVFQMAFAAR
jgi:biopolymer transport protein ExbD